MNDKYLFLIANPNKWFGENSEENYQVNEILETFLEEKWYIGNLKNVHLGMQGVIKISEDQRKSSLLELHEVKRLKSGIYAMCEVTSVENKWANVKIIKNLYAEGNIIPKDEARKIFGSRYNSQGAGYIDKDLFELVSEY